MLKRLVFVPVLVICCLVAAWSGPAAVVTRINPDGVGVNFGRLQQAQQGQEFYVYRNGQWIGRIRLTQIGDNSSVAVVIQTPPGASVQVGDVISSYAPSAVASMNPPPPPVNPPVVPNPPPQPYIPPEPYTGPQFQDLIKQRTKSFTFSVPGSGMPPQLQPAPNYPLYGMMATPFLFNTGFGVSPWNMGLTGYQVYQQTQFQKTMKNSYNTTQSSISVVYWDAKLLSAYANAYVATNVSDPVQQAQIRQNLMVQKGLDKNYIFQVQLTNRGFGPLNIAPFNNHFFLLDNNGNRLIAHRYDPPLDNNITNGAQTQGYVYFDRYDQGGNPTLTGPVKIMVDIQGANTKISW